MHFIYRISLITTITKFFFHIIENEFVTKVETRVYFFLYLIMCSQIISLSTNLPYSII